MIGVSIVIPFKNDIRFIRETLTSLQEQTSPCWEAILVSDHSSDEVIKAVEALQSSEVRFKLYSLKEGNRGANAARNLGWRSSAFDLIIFLDSDDVLESNRVENSIRKYEENGCVDAFAFGYMKFNKVFGDIDSCPIYGGANPISGLLRHENPWMTSSLTWRKEFLEKIEGWDERVFIWQDWELHIRSLICGLSFVECHENGYYWRQYESTGRISSKQGGPELWRQVVRCCDSFASLLDYRCKINPIQARRLLRENYGICFKMLMLYNHPVEGLKSYWNGLGKLMTPVSLRFLLVFWLVGVGLFVLLIKAKRLLIKAIKN